MIGCSTSGPPRGAITAPPHEPHTLDTPPTTTADTGRTRSPSPLHRRGPPGCPARQFPFHHFPGPDSGPTVRAGQRHSSASSASLTERRYPSRVAGPRPTTQRCTSAVDLPVIPGRRGQESPTGFTARPQASRLLSLSQTIKPPYGGRKPCRDPERAFECPTRGSLKRSTYPSQTTSVTDQQSEAFHPQFREIGHVRL